MTPERSGIGMLTGAATGGRRAMAVWLPSWSTDRLLRRERRERDGVGGAPLLLVRAERQRRVVARCCARAAEVGVRPGMALTQARALFGGSPPRVEAFDAAADRGGLVRLAVWAQRFAPVVAVDTASDEPDGLLLDVSGCAHLFGGERGLVERVVDGLARLGFVARAAIAPTFGCAWGVARFGEAMCAVVEVGGAASAMSGLPLEALRIDAAAAGQLREVGIERVGQVLDMPRSALPARFGDQVLLRLDQALGQAMEAIAPVRPTPPPAVERVFDGPTDRFEAVECALRGLLGVVCARLGVRECGARRVEIELVRSHLEPERFEIVLGRPSRDVKKLWTLARPKLEKANLGFGGFGVEAVRVRASAVGRLRHEQAEHVATGAGVREREVRRAGEELVDTLVNRLGVERVRRACLRESHVPERAWAWTGVGDEDAVAAGVTEADRPTVLLEQPEPAEVIALTPDGPVHRVRWRGVEHGVSACVGPERIGGEWWRVDAAWGEARSDADREYYAVCLDETGVWVWLVRRAGGARWFVHGVWS